MSNKNPSKGSPIKKASSKTTPASKDNSSEKLIGKKVASFSLQNGKGEWIALPQAKHTLTVLFFYPKDSTPGCTIENQDFSALAEKFRALGVGVYGVSQDSVQSHDKFSCKYDLKNDLLSDVDGKICELFDVIKEKNMYGKKFMGIERSTFILNAQFEVIDALRKVKVDGHAASILQRASQILQKT